MKLAVIIGIQNYAGSTLTNLPGCATDVQLLQTILSGQQDPYDVLTISDRAAAADLKPQLIEFITRHKGNPVREFLFYYSGHGAFINGEYYYLLSDYNSSRLHQTSLENTELDTLIRALAPSLTTKLVDACQSGVPYIKDQGEIDQYLKGTQPSFRSCYFMFSSRTDESSYQDNVLSHFTRAIGEVVASRVGIVRYKDLIDYVSDSFAQSSNQTPFFVVQADFTDAFCAVDAALRDRVSALLSATSKAPSPNAPPPPETKPATFKELVLADASLYCSKEEATGTLKRLPELLADSPCPPDAADIFDPSVTELPDYRSIPRLAAIGKWLSEARHEFFAEPTWEHVKVRKPKPYVLLQSMTSVSFLGGQQELADDDYIEVTESRVSGVRATTDMPFACVALKGSSKCPNVNSAICFVVPFISRTSLLLFAGTARYAPRGWEEELDARDLRWQSAEQRMKDHDGLSTIIRDIVTRFWQFALAPIKGRLGLLAEEGSAAATGSDK